MTNEVIASGSFTDDSHSTVVEHFTDSCKDFFEKAGGYHDCPTHTVEQRARDWADSFKTPESFLRQLTSRIGEFRIEWELTDKKLRIGFFHHDAPVGAPVTVTPIEWVECRNPECVEINAKESFQNEILGNPDFKYGYCKYCAPQFKVEFENMTYPYQVKFMFESKSQFVIDVESDVEPFPNSWWLEWSDDDNSEFVKVGKELHWATITRVVEGVIYTKFINGTHYNVSHEGKQKITEQALAKAKSSGVVFDKWDCVLIVPMDIAKN